MIAADRIAEVMMLPRPVERLAELTAAADLPGWDLPNQRASQAHGDA